MHMDTQSLKHRFLTYELGLLSLKAALSTRNEGWPIYDASKKPHQRTRAKEAFRAVLEDIEKKYIEGSVTEEDHNRCIVDVAADLSLNLKDHLYQGRFRIGISQKLVNIHLKYLWAAGLCPEPPHCPIDGIIRDIAKIDYDWTRSDSINEYKRAISSLRKGANGISLSIWELRAFRRRDDKGRSIPVLVPAGDGRGVSATIALARGRTQR